MGMQLPKYEIKLCKIQEVSDSLHLLTRHWDELVTRKDVMVLNPDYNKYEKLELMGVLISLAAYHNGLLVGYSVNFLQKHLHYADLLCGYNDLLYIDEEHRRGSLGLNLIRETQRVLKERGAKLMLWHARVNTKLSAILPKLGCDVQEIIYSKEL